MSLQQNIIAKINSTLNPEALSVENESYSHAVPENSETHFKITVVSNKFTQHNRVKRHQIIYQIIEAELQLGVHAVALHTYTVKEWQERKQSVNPSPDCMGKG